MKIIILQYLISGVSIFFVLLRIAFPAITIDSITLGLIVIAVLPWMAPLFKTVELPGGLKVEFQELLKVGKKADELGLLSSLNDHPEINRYEQQLVGKSDPNLALAGLRFEIEYRLRNMAKKKEVDVYDKSGSEIVKILVNEKVFKKNEGQAIQEMLDLLNSAVHGAKVDKLAVEWVNDVGPRILYTLDHR